MSIIAVGVSYNKNNMQRQACVVVTDEHNGEVSHLNLHKHHANKVGHGWIDLDPILFSRFSESDLINHLKDNYSIIS